MIPAARDLRNENVKAQALGHHAGLRLAELSEVIPAMGEELCETRDRLLPCNFFFLSVLLSFFLINSLLFLRVNVVLILLANL